MPIQEIPDWDEIALQSRQRMARVDAMPPGMRDLVHEYNLGPVAAVIQEGVRDLEEMREVLGVLQSDGVDAAIERVAEIRRRPRVAREPNPEHRLVRPKHGTAQ